MKLRNVLLKLSFQKDVNVPRSLHALSFAAAPSTPFLHLVTYELKEGDWHRRLPALVGCAVAWSGGLPLRLALAPGTLGSTEVCLFCRVP